MRFLSFRVVLLPILVVPSLAAAVEDRACETPAGALVSVQGQVDYREGNEWRPADVDQTLCDRDSLRTGANSRAAVRLADDAVLRLDANTTLVLSDVAPEPEEPSLLQLVFGAIHSFSRRPQTLEVDTPYVNATIEGTEFALRVSPDESALTVIEGNVLAANEFGSVRVAGGNAAVASKGSAPRSVLLADPSDAVQWGLYYPPTLARAPGAAADPTLAEAERLAAAGRPDAAINLLARAPGTADRMLYRAALLASVGQAEDAEAVIAAVLADDPSNGRALAQSAVIDVVRNDRESALDKAGRAVSAAPDDPAPYIARSFAEQADFRLEAARDTLLEAAERVPDSPLVWARLSEVWLTLGYRSRSEEAAIRALELDPDLERAHVMQGFAALTEYRTADATASFERAIALDPADPMPRLGRGLALIRDGDLEAGRAEIDAAVALDSTRSLLRSYLGKAYFEEDRNELAVEQFELAKQYDPEDPTPYLYDAIRLQTENRPGEALAEIQTSIELNDNRAPYRGRLQLDQDAAARGASLGRIYEDLGFIQLGMREATRSQSIDPSNAAAHRFLADIYRSERRRELARVSELTRAMLLQDIGLTPVQPSLTETNLNLVSSGGPANAGFNEFNSLFASDGWRFTGSALGGTDATWGGEIAFAAQHENAAVSVGAFEYGSDGFRDNFDVRHTIYDVFGQVAISPELNLQFEARYRDTENGDLFMNFDPDDFDPTFRQEFSEGSVRFGARYSPDPHNTTLFSFIAADRDTEQSFFIPEIPPPPIAFGPSTFQAQLEGHSFLGELQHIYQRDNFSLTFGGAVSEARFDNTNVFLPELFPGVIEAPSGNFDASAYRAYGYGTLELPYGFTLTGGLSYDVVDSGDWDVNKVNPKGGVEWRPIDDLVLRGFYASTVKPPVATNRTIEPTQIAGFNQYFDDANATKSRRYGFGLDYQITDWLAVGGEMTWRNLDVPYEDFAFVGGVPTTVPTFADHEERTHRAYLYALPHPRVPVSVEFVYDKFEAAENLLTQDPTAIVPTGLETISVPVTIGYFDPSGVFGAVRGTYVHQEVERSAGVPLATGDSDFFLVDVSLGYRFPNQRGSLTLEARNITDQDFRYQDDGFREFGDEPSTGPYFPGVSVLGRLTLNF